MSLNIVFIVQLLLYKYLEHTFNFASQAMGSMMVYVITTLLQTRAT